jgi:mannitol/fructose-specific phosphotransferase system IIA component (Ntr-type)
MALVDLIGPEVVKIPLEGQTKPAVIREMLEVLREAGKISEVDSAYRAVLDRENGSTGLENGIAVPHAKSDTVESLTVAIGISPKGVDFDSLDGEPSRLFFLMLAPPNQSGPHIEALAEIARITRSQAFCNLLSSARSPREVVDLFREE